MRALLAVVAAGALDGCDWSMAVDVHTTVTPAAFAAVGSERQELLCAPPTQPVTFRAVIHDSN